MKRLIPVLIILFVISQVTPAERPSNEIPMYGGEYEPSVEQNKEFSKSAVDLGWKYYYQGDLDTAIKRFNQGWMFDRDNPDVYWGFGLIMGQRASSEETEKNLNESIRFLETAKNKRPNDGRIIGDLAFSHTILGYHYKSEGNDQKSSLKHLKEAGIMFPQAFKLNPKYPPIVSNWSVFYFYTEEYQKAKDKAHEAIKMGYTFSPEYMKDLTEKLKEANQQVEPIVTTPVDEVEPQSTQAHP